MKRFISLTNEIYEPPEKLGMQGLRAMEWSLSGSGPRMYCLFLDYAFLTTKKSAKFWHHMTMGFLIDLTRKF